jgi:hypothetical protein
VLVDFGLAALRGMETLMSSALLESLREQVEEDLDGIASTPEGLRSVADARYGEVTIRIDHDEEAAAIRVQVSLPPPAGAGKEFLLWCLATNTQYWDVKFGLDEDGMLAVHADLEAEGPQADESLANDVVDRVESILQLLDEDLSEYLLAHELGTPAQRARWERRRPGAEEELVD